MRRDIGKVTVAKLSWNQFNNVFTLLFSFFGAKLRTVDGDEWSIMYMGNSAAISHFQIDYYFHELNNALTLFMHQVKSYNHV
jgi:hypothetical protein